MVPSLRNTPFVLTILSSLAEGAERIVVREILNVGDSMLDVVLPLDKNDYLREFETRESVEEFEELLSKAKSIRHLPARDDRIEAYRQAGRYIVDQCDVLLALWGGGQVADEDGVGETVQYARDTDCPLVWIHTEDQCQITVESEWALNTGLFRDLDKYNAEPVSSSELEQQIDDRKDSLMGVAKRSELQFDNLRAISEYFLYYAVRSDLLAQRYKNLYYRTESLVYVLALAAVAIAAFQILFIPDMPMILISEVVLMLAVLALVWVSRRRRWHAKWIDYRFLAERCHSALFMTVASIDVAPLRPPRHLSLSYSSKDWIVAAFSSVWSRRPQFQESITSKFEGLKSFLCEAWIEDQIRYHDSTSRHHFKRNRLMSSAGYILFGLTICAAVFHAINAGSHLLESVLAFMAIVFPATAASITAIRTHRNYLRSSMRSAEMVYHLKELKSEMMLVDSFAGLHQSLKEVEQTMLHENEDWRVVVRFHVPELPA
jgi:hypothetical protein